MRAAAAVHERDFVDPFGENRPTKTFEPAEDGYVISIAVPSLSGDVVEHVADQAERIVIARRQHAEKSSLLENLTGNFAEWRCLETKRGAAAPPASDVTRG